MEVLVRFRWCLLCVVLCAIVTGSAYAVPNPLARGIQIVSSTPVSLEVEYRPQVSGFDTIVVAGTTTLLPRIAGAEVEQTLRSGVPALLSVRLPVSVPSSRGYRIDRVAVQQVVSHVAVMTPVPSYRATDLAPVPVYTIDEAAYRQTAAPSWADLTYEGLARTRHLASLRLVAARYDAATASIQIPSVIRVRISFLPDAISPLAMANREELPLATVNAREAAAWKSAASVLSAAKRSTAVQSSGGTWVRIGVESEGIYSIDAQALKNAGLSITPGEVRTIKLFGYGGQELPERVSAGANNQMIEQPIIVRTTPSGELQSVVFYGASPYGFVYDPQADGREKFAHFINHYSRRTYYLLTVGGSDGLRATPAEEPSGTVVHSPRTYTARLFNEEELYNIFSPGSDRRWLGRIANKDIPNTYTTLLPNLVREAGASVFYRFSVANRAKTASNFAISENGTKIATISCSAMSESYSYASVSSLTAVADVSTIKDDRSVLQFLYTPVNGSQSASGNVDWFEIHYPREFVASGNELEYFSNPTLTGVTEYSINGFSGEVLGFDVTDRAQPVLLRNQASTGGMFRFRTDHQPQSPQRFYLSGALKSPVSVDVVDVAGLRTSFANTDVIVITSKALLESAQAYRAYREAQGELSVSVVTVDQLYNEFAAGMPDPTAIRDYLAFALANWEVKPRYAILWGDGHYDYKNISTSEPMHVPTYQTYSYEDGQMNSVNVTSAIEDYFARISGDDKLVDIALGRIPIRSNTEGMNVVEKIRHYEHNSSLDLWRTRITLIADDVWTTETPNGEGLYHTPQSETLSTNFIPPFMYQKKIYLPEYPTENIPGGRRKPRVTEELLNAVNNGTLILNWIGHGNPRVWAHEEIFEKDITIPLMTNRDKLFFLTAATCDFGRIDDPNRQSGAEELFTSTAGGAIGVFSATRTVISQSNAALNEEFYSYLLAPRNGVYPRLGDAIYLTKQERDGWNDQKFFLLGDPTLRLHMPQQQIRVTTLNGVAVPADTPQQVQALSRLTITGEVLTADGTTVDAGFNGSVIFSLYDSDVDKSVQDVGQYRHNYFVFGGLLSISADSVRNGTFSITMVVPQDISFSDKEGRLAGYAFSSASTAVGMTRDFLIGGVDTTAVNDGNGPNIDVFLDTYTFRAGDLVRPEPVLMVDLYDETGINATGLGIGHDIEAWIDGSADPIRLTRDFTISLDDFRKGTVTKQLFGLASGTHRVRVRAWDVFNNFSEVETYFRIPGDDSELFVEDVYSYPNPFAEQTAIFFRHNQLGGMSATVSVYTIDGRLVRTLQEAVTMRSATILWDGRDEAGSFLPNGVYLYKLQLSSGEGRNRETTGKMVINR